MRDLERERSHGAARARGAAPRPGAPEVAREQQRDAPPVEPQHQRRVVLGRLRARPRAPGSSTVISARAEPEALAGSPAPGGARAARAIARTAVLAARLPAARSPRTRRRGSGRSTAAIRRSDPDRSASARPRRAGASGRFQRNGASTRSPDVEAAGAAGAAVHQHRGPSGSSTTPHRPGRRRGSHAQHARPRSVAATARARARQRHRGATTTRTRTARCSHGRERERGVPRDRPSGQAGAGRWTIAAGSAAAPHDDRGSATMTSQTKWKSRAARPPRTSSTAARAAEDGGRGRERHHEQVGDHAGQRELVEVRRA